MEIKTKQLKKIPENWIKISGTKQVSRFHTPFIVSRLKAREEHKERLVLCSENAYHDFLM
jgi:DNA mismatch repair protein MSH3